MRLLYKWERDKVPTFGGLFCNLITLPLFLAVVYFTTGQLHRSLILILVIDNLMPDGFNLYNIS